MAKKPKKTTRGTDEAFLKLMTVSGSSLLKLLGVPPEQADKYQFRSVTLKEKHIKPDVQGIPILKSEEGLVFLEFQGYSDPFIRLSTGSLGVSRLYPTGIQKERHSRYCLY
ncbi:MAG TPA: DUF2887 domain-containing protein [Thioploca sp.]|nr:MAG: hypothetical protein B6247_01455 [Beggiatoa sp. 4572_84]RKZ64258.1 MAG: hypothetical protein DRR08_01320 [Gammaproteobacteria bacterium]HDN27234.1 DUF2887 domain-containing protein [Thioploca sp.]